MRIECGDEPLSVSHGKNATYRSPNKQNQIIEIYAKVLNDFISKKIKKSGAYAILAEKTADMSGKSQLTIWVEFVGFIELKKMDTVTITENIREAIVKMDLDTDNAWDWGSLVVLQRLEKHAACRQFKKKSFSKSFYFHCESHQLNLVVNDLKFCS